MPTEIREDEAHLTHVIVAQSIPNTKTMEFDVTARVVMLNQESLAAVKSQLPKYGTIVVLHDGEEWKKEQADTAKKAKAEADEKAKEEAEAKLKEDEARAKSDKEKDERIAELEAKLKAVPKESKKAEKTEADDKAKEADAKEAEAKKGGGNGRG